MTQSVYSEVYAILNTLGDEYIDKLPKKLMELIISEKVSSYNPVYNLDIPIEEQNMSEDALAMITFFNLKYWCDPIEKEEILKDLRENEKKYKSASAEQNISIAEEKTVESIRNEIRKEEVAMVAIKEDIWSKFVNMIKRIFSRR